MRSAVTLVLVLRAGVVLASSHERMLSLLAEIRDRAPEEHTYLSDREARRIRARLSAMKPGALDLVRLELHLKLGEEEQRLGNEAAAIESLTTAYRLLPRVREDVAEEWIVRLLFRLGMAHLRLGETRNCALTSSPDACLFPIRGGGIHLDQEPSREAIRYFAECLEEALFGSDPYLSARWLINIAYMTVDGYPDDVPPSYVIPEERFAFRARLPAIRERGSRRQRRHVQPRRGCHRRGLRPRRPSRSRRLLGRSRGPDAPVHQRRGGRFHRAHP